MKRCITCGCFEFHHFRSTGPCLSSHCSGKCRGFQEVGAVVRPPDASPMYAVRIDKGDKPGSYVFNVEPMDWMPDELIAMDSTPGIIAMVHAADPASAAKRAWEKALDDLPQVAGLIGDKR